jgi:hypothetical protein
MNLEEGIEDNKAISSTLSVQARKEISRLSGKRFYR